MIYLMHVSMCMPEKCFIIIITIIIIIIIIIIVINPLGVTRANIEHDTAI